MTREDIVRMAQEAGDDWEHTLPKDRSFIEAFAKLVAAAERENICKQIAALHDSISLVSDAVIKVRG